MSTNQTINSLLNVYLNYNNDKVEKEFEIRFKPRKSYNKNDYDNLYSTLLSLGFTCENLNGENLLRIYLENSDDKIWSKTFGDSSKFELKYLVFLKYKIIVKLIK